MFRIFKEFESLRQTYGGDMNALLLNVIGGLLIAITFITIGVICTILAKHRDGDSKKRVVLTKIVGLFLMSCGFARVISVICTWHNLAILDGWVKVITGAIAIVAIIYIPGVIKDIKSNKELEEAAKMLHETKRDLSEIKKINERLNDNP